MLRLTWLISCSRIQCPPKAMEPGKCIGAVAAATSSKYNMVIDTPPIGQFCKTCVVPNDIQRRDVTLGLFLYEGGAPRSRLVIAVLRVCARGARRATRTWRKAAPDAMTSAEAPLGSDASGSRSTICGTGFARAHAGHRQSQAVIVDGALGRVHATLPAS
jgi:hypothetical protein